MVDKQIKHGSGALVFLLWENFAFLVIFSDETADVEESSATAVFVVFPGSLPQVPDRQASDDTYNDHPGNDESGDVKTTFGRRAFISRKNVNGLRGHRRSGG